MLQLDARTYVNEFTRDESRIKNNDHDANSRQYENSHYSFSDAPDNSISDYRCMKNDF